MEPLWRNTRSGRKAAGAGCDCSMDQQAVDSSNAFVFLALMYGVGTGILAYALLLWRGRVAAARRAAEWSTVEGEVHRAGIVHERNYDSADDFIADVRFAYRVAGRTYEGDALRVGGKTVYQNRGLAELALLPYGPGAPVRVFYDPRRPERAVLEPRPTGAGLKDWVLFGVFLLASAAYTTLALLA